MILELPAVTGVRREPRAACWILRLRYSLGPLRQVIQVAQTFARFPSAAVHNVSSLGRMACKPSTVRLSLEPQQRATAVRGRAYNFSLMDRLEEFALATLRMDGSKRAYLDYVRTHPEPDDLERKRRMDNASRAIEEWWHILEGC